jgi:hypothetical protein
MVYAFDKANANAPSRHHTQYFEMMGDHALYHDGWIASTKVVRPPWDVAGAVTQDPAGLPWELYDLSKDWAQYEDVAGKQPAKLKELQNLFWAEDDGEEAARQTMERTIPLILQWDENFHVGAGTGTPVDDNDYQVPFRFTGKLDKLTLTIDRPKLTAEDEKRLMESQRNNHMSE